MCLEWGGVNLSQRDDMGGSEFLCRVIYTHYGTGYPSQPGRKGRISGLIFSTEAWEVLPQVKPQSRGPSQACGLQREGRTLGNPQCGHTPSELAAFLLLLCRQSPGTIGQQLPYNAWRLVTRHLSAHSSPGLCAE